MRARVWTCDNPDCHREARTEFDEQRAPEDWFVVTVIGNSKREDRRAVYCSEACARKHMGELGA